MSEDEACVSAVQYNPKTGMIIGLRYGFYGDIEQENHAFILGEADIIMDYVDVSLSPPVIKRRLEMQITQSKTRILSNGADAMALSSLPIPAQVQINSETYNVPDGELEWGTVMPATYKITVRAFPYLDWEGEVTAVAGDTQT